MARRKVGLAFKKLIEFVKDSDGQKRKLINCAGAPGTRATPPFVHDPKIGARLHYGRKVMVNGVEHQQYHLMLNKNAEDKAIRELEKKYPNKKWATASFPAKAADREEDNEEVIDNMMEDIEEQINESDDEDD